MAGGESPPAFSIFYGQAKAIAAVERHRRMVASAQLVALRVLAAGFLRVPVNALPDGGA